MSGHDHARALLALANDDLKACRRMVRDVEDFSDAIFGFHIQQAIEKAFKAWLARALTLTLKSSILFIIDLFLPLEKEYILS
ncbi:MAG: HEPN domain-containing protein [Magnetococcales bacterium]|nr:HEPN domain-containing protein [Magnetococcales bacterium]